MGGVLCCVEQPRPGTLELESAVEDDLRIDRNQRHDDEETFHDAHPHLENGDEAKRPPVKVHSNNNSSPSTTLSDYGTPNAHSPCTSEATSFPTSADADDHNSRPEVDGSDAHEHATADGEARKPARPEGDFIDANGVRNSHKITLPHTLHVLRYQPEWERLKPGEYAEIPGKYFKVRGLEYLTDRKKYPSPDPVYSIRSMDMFKTPGKLQHVGRGIHLPEPKHRIDGVPPYFIVNILLPNYPASFMGKVPPVLDTMNVVLVFELKESVVYDEEFKKGHTCQLLKEMWKDPDVPIEGGRTYARDRLKCLPMWRNSHEFKLGLERNVVDAYNGKPFLYRPQHDWYSSENYMEVNLDVHRFKFLAKKTVETFKSRLKLMTLDMAFVIEGRTREELPEKLLCAARLNKVDIPAGPAWPVPMPKLCESAFLARDPSLD